MARIVEGSRGLLRPNRKILLDISHTMTYHVLLALRPTHASPNGRNNGLDCDVYIGIEPHISLGRIPLLLCAARRLTRCNPPPQ